MMVAQNEIEKKVLVSAADSVTGSTPLMFAAIENRMQVMERLVSLGCDINKRNKENYTALHFGEDNISALIIHALTGSEHVRQGGHGQLAAGQAGQHGDPGRAAQAVLHPPRQRQAEWTGVTGVVATTFCQGLSVMFMRL